MTETSVGSPEALPDTLADMLPVGMISAGGMAAMAMAAVAQRQQGQSDWEAFHYERISDTEFEITGGIAVHTAGSKKFQGAHETVIISEAAVLAEMRQQLSLQKPGTAEGNVGPSAKHDPVKADMATAPLLKVVFSLPQDEAGQQRILRAFQLQADFFGAKVQACSLHDASLLKLE